MTPQSMLELAGIPITTALTKRLVESTSRKEAAMPRTINQPVYLRVGYMDDATIYAITGCPPNVNASNFDDEIQNQLTPDEHELYDAAMDEGDDNTLFAADVLDPTSAADQEDIANYPQKRMSFAKFLRLGKDQLHNPDGGEM